ncbi:MAG: TetR/AcrR family transcriptional regulator [Sporichthyaceae bacterium]|nr:TetR/AcrR family transcriptional regulator [Sporichthyaceae bacterium]
MSEVVPVAGRDTAICEATLALLAEVGYDRMSMDAVAARAHASKATIYRRWPGKRELVLEAVRRRHEPPATLPDTGSLRGDLASSLSGMAAPTSCDEADLMAGVLRAMRRAPELGKCMRDQVMDRKRAVFRTIVARAVARGELPAGASADLAHEVAGALWVQRVLVVGGDVDDAFIDHVVDDVLIPLLCHPLSSPQPHLPSSPAPDAVPQETQ